MNTHQRLTGRYVELIALVGVALIVGGVLGYIAARATGVAAVSGVGLVDMGESGGTLEANGRSYAVPWDVAWKGRDGAWRDSGSGHPDCLTAGGTRLRIVYWGVDGPIGPQVVAVDCSNASPAD